MSDHWGMVDWGVGYGQGCVVDRCVVDGCVSDGELRHVVSDGDAGVGGGGWCVSDQWCMVDRSMGYSERSVVDRSVGDSYWGVRHHY